MIRDEGSQFPENSSIEKLNSFFEQIVTNLNNFKFESKQKNSKILEKIQKKFKIIQKCKKYQNLQKIE